MTSIDVLQFFDSFDAGSSLTHIDAWSMRCLFRLSHFANFGSPHITIKAEAQYANVHKLWCEILRLMLLIATLYSYPSMLCFCIGGRVVVL